MPGEYTGWKKGEVQGPPRSGGGSRGANLTKQGYKNAQRRNNSHADIF